jgi:hypothetical protein
MGGGMVAAEADAAPRLVSFAFNGHVEGFTANLERVNRDHGSRMRVKLKSDFFESN